MSFACGWVYAYYALARDHERTSGDMPSNSVSMGYVIPPSVPTNKQSQWGGKQQVVIFFALQGKHRYWTHDAPTRHLQKITYNPPWNLYVLMWTSRALPSLSTKLHLCKILLAHTVINEGCKNKWYINEECLYIHITFVCMYVCNVSDSACCVILAWT